MKILIVGAGGVGGYLAGKLLECGKNVSVMLTPETKEIVRKNGLKIIDVDKEFVVYPNLEIEGIYDIVFVTTKYYHLDEVIEKIKPYINKNSIIVPVLNGVAHFEKFKKLNSKILKACIYILSNKKAPGVIYKKTPLFYLCIEDDEKIREVFEGCDLKIKFSKNIDEDIWKKYLFISTFATLQSYYKKPTGWIMENKRGEVEKFLDEVIRIAKEYGVDLSSEKEKVIKQALNIPYESKMSMQIDFENNQPTEVETLTGFLAKKSEFINEYYRKLNAGTFK
ncbi:ketopantoate reductase family protein [Nautilia lithotrophica]